MPTPQPLTLNQLTPYLSVVLAEVRQGVTTNLLVERVLGEALRVAGVGDSNNKVLASTSNASTVDGLRVIAARYTEDRRPGWSAIPSLVDHLNQLVVVCRFNRLVAVHVSDAGLKSAIASRIRREPDTDSLSALLAPIPSGRMNAAFVRGETRTLWLSGTHRRTRVKADSKTLSGLDLRDSLDPAADQSYFFSAARARPDGLGQDITVGVSPSKSTMWIGATTTWAEYRGVTRAVLEHLGGTADLDEAPLPVLATRVSDASDMAGAFDVGLQPPESFVDDDGDVVARQLWESWAYDTSFQVTGDDGNANFTASVSRRGDYLGEISVTVDAGRPDRVRLGVDVTEVGATPADLHELVGHLRRGVWVKVYYDSGHTIADQAVYSMRRRDQPFTGWEWQNFADIDVAVEKPPDLTTTGQVGGTSLFDWVARDYVETEAGWLLCDDGAGEIADFVHLTTAIHPPVLSLIHVKAAGSHVLERQTAVSKYEVVTSQAVKNLRFLDRIISAEGLAGVAQRAVGDLVWHDRAVVPRADFLAQLDAIGDNHRRRVIIVQPHQRRTRYATPTGGDIARVPMLNDLLLSTDAACRGVGASLTVVGHDS